MRPSLHSNKNNKLSRCAWVKWLTSIFFLSSTIYFRIKDIFIKNKWRNRERERKREKSFFFFLFLFWNQKQVKEVYLGKVFSNLLLISSASKRLYLVISGRFVWSIDDEGRWRSVALHRRSAQRRSRRWCRRLRISIYSSSSSPFNFNNQRHHPISISSPPIIPGMNPIHNHVAIVFFLLDSTQLPFICIWSWKPICKFTVGWIPCIDFSNNPFWVLIRIMFSCVLWVVLMLAWKD